MSRTTFNRSRPYWLRAYYGPGGPGQRRPQEAGKLAFEVEWSTEDARDMEAKLAMARDDIERIETGQNG